MSNLPKHLHETPVEREAVLPELALGQWYWVQSTRSAMDPDSGVRRDEPYEWLGCVMQIGSNFVELHSPHSGNGYSTARVHFDNFWTDIRFEPNADEAIRGRIAHFQGETQRLLGEVQALTARLGLKSVGALPQPAVDNHGTALVTLSAQTDITSYKHALVQAKDEILPALFEQIKKNNVELTLWMTANTMPMLAMSGELQGSIDEIKDRISNVSLYAGITEEAVKCCEGQPAGYGEKLHVMQRRAYMDEECLLDYQAGGMDFDGIAEFDAWISRPENRDRILPFPRTLVAMQVRRKKKEREWDGTLLDAYVRMRLEQADRLTFLYIRNGEQVWRLSSEQDFGALIFPDKSMFAPDEPKMVKMFAGRIDKMITVAEYEAMSEEYEDKAAEYKAWSDENPDKSWIEFPGDFRALGGEAYIDGYSFSPSDWRPFDQSNVHFDECMREIEKRIKEYNRIALIIQGLFDRSEVLHPHPPVKSWTPAGFEEAITLVYDGTMVLHHGEAPDFKAYLAKCNESMSADSVVTGQELFWLRKEAEKENNRLDFDRRYQSSCRHTTYRPYGNPGPGTVARMAQWKPRAREAVFAWYRMRLRDQGYFSAAQRGDSIRTTLTVPASELFNISAYTPGDFKQFFRDPRTRAQYIKWAPLLLTAEDYHAGKIAVQEPVGK